MLIRPIPPSSSHTRFPARLGGALVVAVALLAAACAGDAPSGLHPSAMSLTRGTTPGAASGFAVLAATTVTCTGASTVAGDVGVSPGTAITGFGTLCTTTGALHAGDAVAGQAQAAAHTEYSTLSGSACDRTFGAVQELAGLTLRSGTYCFPSSATLQVGGILTLDGGGQFIFKVGSTFITFTGSSIVLTGGASCGNVTWLVGSSATLGGAVVGSILAFTSIGMDPGASLTGRAIALGGAVTMSGQNTVTLCGTSGGNGGGGGGGGGKQKCNQGVGNGPEGCDPGNSNQGDAGRSNDERGGRPGHPGRKGGNGN